MNNRKDHELVGKRTRVMMNSMNTNINSNVSSHSHDVIVPSSLMSPLQNQSLFNPHSNGFPFWSSDEIINNTDHHHQLSLDLSATTLLDNNNEQQTREASNEMMMMLLMVVVS
ncbi:hypothetical protein MTR_6g048900 [Medicago truncatula]|uniref:Uncharacterized protein n=1 Tax=Medicago truncatula TaxID=3880 RepID=A0A072U9D2_MEDTR|nr:hypothetical protein MTR_6g048900 [Medicago truncatula]